MKVTFVKKDARRYAVVVRRERYPDLWCGSIGYDDFLPHDVLHFVAEAEFGLDGAIFGDLAAGGNARLFQPFDRDLTAKLWRKQRIRRTRLPDGRRSEELARELERRWRAKTLPTELQQKLDGIAERWHALQVGGSSRSNGRDRRGEGALRLASATARPPRDGDSVPGCLRAPAAPASPFRPRASGCSRRRLRWRPTR